jgi:tetratricopeptide (TPR) repeat protein
MISQIATAKDYQSYDEAMADAQKAIEAKNYLGSEEPLEAAFELAEDDRQRIEAYRKLIDAYELHPQIDDMRKACEFIMDHSTSAPERFIYRNNLLDFVEKKKKADDLISHFKERLKSDENDRTALLVLSEAYARLKDDSEQSANLTERLEQVIDSSGEEADVLTYAQLATQYINAKKYQKGAELYEKIAPLDETMAPWNWKEAAAAWLKAGEKEKALQAALNSTKAGPESRPGLLPYYWNSALGDIFLELDNSTLAISHYEKALESTKIKRYVDSTKQKLEKAREKAK